MSLKGVTGAGNLDIESVKENLVRLRKNTDLPVGVGFGIKDAESAKKVSKIAEAVVVGSALINKIEELDSTRQYNLDELKEHISLIKDMRDAMDD